MLARVELEDFGQCARPVAVREDRLHARHSRLVDDLRGDPYAHVYRHVCRHVRDVRVDMRKTCVQACAETCVKARRD